MKETLTIVLQYRELESGSKSTVKNDRIRVRQAVPPCLGTHCCLYSFWELSLVCRNQLESQSFAISHEDRLRLIEENVRDYAIFTLTPDGKVASWNLGAERILGYAEPEVIGMEFFHIFTSEDRDIGVPQREMEIARLDGQSRG